MQELINSLEVELEKLINDKLYTSFKSEIRNEHSDFESLQKSIFQTYENSAGKLSKAELKAEILSLISQSWNASDGQPSESSVRSGRIWRRVPLRGFRAPRSRSKASQLVEHKAHGVECGPT